MKFAIAIIMSATEAVRLQDAPPFFNEPSWRETFPSAAGLAQVKSACQMYGVAGVPCESSNVQFASGMIGDEDLGEDITMKGSPYHFIQGKRALAQTSWVPVVVKSTGPLPECHGNNGPDGVNCTRPICNGTNGPQDGHTGAPCTREEPAAIPHYNTDPTAGRPYQTSGDITPTHPADPVAAAPASLKLSQVSWVPVVVKSTGPLPECHGNNGPDGVNCTRPICNGTNGPLDGHSGAPCTREEPAAIPHYNTDPTAGRPYQTSGDITPTHPADPVAAAPAALKLSQADPAPAAPAKAEAAAAAAPKADTKGYPAPEKVLTLDPKIARTHTTFYYARE